MADLDHNNQTISQKMPTMPAGYVFWYLWMCDVDKLVHCNAM